MMKRRAFLKLPAALGVCMLPRAAPAIAPAEVAAPGPWECVHSGGIQPCHGIAFYAIVKPEAGDILNPANFRRLDGSMPKGGDPIVCGTCGARVMSRTRGFPLSLREAPMNRSA